MIVIGYSTSQAVREPYSVISCPVCQCKTQSGEAYSATYFTVFWLPIIPISETPNGRACLQCGNVFDEGQLNANNHFRLQDYECIKCGLVLESPGQECPLCAKRARLESK